MDGLPGILDPYVAGDGLDGDVAAGLLKRDVTGCGLHLRDSVQPRINTALALEKLLGPLLRSAGLSDVHFRFRIGGGVVSEEELRTLTTTTN